MKRLRVLLPLLLLGACARAPNPDAAFFLAQAPADPELRIADAYKWIVHATRGGEHAVESEFAVRKWLESEWAAPGPPQPDEPLWMPLAADGRIGRLNLRPYRARGGDPDALLAAFLAGAEAFDADPARFRRAWKALGRELENRPIGHLTADEWRRFDREMRVRGYPACHHSPEYEAARRPAYRVLPAAQARLLLEALGLWTNQPFFP
ncbi:MAG TPA: hypothetical protein P5204_05790 [Kiritimatiellia bacterium]|nr:hypothetical protein [Kiritimatiellia bacterium]